MIWTIVVLVVFIIFYETYSFILRRVSEVPAPPEPRPPVQLDPFVAARTVAEERRIALLKLSQMRTNGLITSQEYGRRARELYDR